MEGKGVPALIAIYQDPSKKAKKDRAGLGQGHRRHARRRHPNHLQGGNRDRSVRRTDRPLRRRVGLDQAGYETLVEAGYQPEMAYFECLHELKLIVDLMNEAGISGMRFSISETAKWGDVSVGPKIIDAGVKKRMKAALKDIQSGKFAKGWVKEYNGGYKKYNALLKAGEKHPIESVGQRLRWLDAVDEKALRQRRAGGVLRSGILYRVPIICNAAERTAANLSLQLAHLSIHEAGVSGEQFAGSSETREPQRTVRNVPDLQWHLGRHKACW